jgi:hypothetical protein
MGDSTRNDGQEDEHDEGNQVAPHDCHVDGRFVLSLFVHSRPLAKHLLYEKQ